MVTITNGIKIFRVSAGAVKPYEGMGFHIATAEELEEMKQAQQDHFDDAGTPVSETFESETSETSEKEDNEHTEDSEDDEESGEGETGMSKEDAAYIEELLEKPLSQWSNEEVKEFVRIKGIDTSGAQKVSQVRAIIKTYLEEQNKNA